MWTHMCGLSSHVNVCMEEVELSYANSHVQFLTCYRTHCLSYAIQHVYFLSRQYVPPHVRHHMWTRTSPCSTSWSTHGSTTCEATYAARNVWYPRAHTLTSKTSKDTYFPLSMKSASQRRFIECNLSLKKFDAQNLSFRSIRHLWSCVVNGYQRISNGYPTDQRERIYGLHVKAHVGI